jgi:hypothetical protein
VSVKTVNRRKNKPGAGRPTKRTAAITARIGEAISLGLTYQEAAEIVGIDDDTLTRWNKIPEFYGAIKSACAAGKLARLKYIVAGVQGWQGSAWFLERRFPAEFARPELQLNQQFNINVPPPRPPPMVRIISIPDSEFEECLAKSIYKQLADGSLERTEGVMTIRIFRQSAATLEDL